MTKFFVLFSCLFLFFINTTAVVGQTIINGLTSSYGQHLEAQFVPGQTLTVSLQAWPGGAANWSRCIEFVNFAGTPTNTCVLGINPNQPNLLITENATTLDITPQNGIAEGNYFIRVQASNASSTFVGTIEMALVIRNAFSMLFVLDRSGSMECRDNEGAYDVWPCTAVPALERRWSKLRDAMVAFVSPSNLSAEDLVPNDRMGVVYFDGNVFPAPAPLAGFVDVPTFRANISANMGNPAILGRNGTSFGDGLYEALINRFPGAPADNRKAVFLFTDGEENRLADVDHLTRAIVGAPSAIDLDDGAFVDIEFYAVAASSVAPGDPFATIMAVANGDPDHYRLPPAPPALGSSNFVVNFANDMFTSFFSLYSPHYIGFEEELVQTINQATFEANKDIRQLVFKANFEKPLARTRNYKIERNGIEVPLDSFDVEILDYAALFSLDFQERSTMKSEGKWTFTASRNTINITAPPIAAVVRDSSNLRLSLTANDHLTHFKPSILEDKLVVGGKMTPMVFFSYKDQAINNALVTVEVFKPGASIGDLLARTSTPPLNDPDLEKGSCTLQKLVYLQENRPDILNTVMSIPMTKMVLPHLGNGRYSQSIPDLDVTGVYKVVYTAEVDIPGVGKVIRTLEHTPLVLFTDIDWNLQPRSVSIKRDGNEYFSKATIQPSYRNNSTESFVGPNYPKSFSVKSEEVQLESVSENCEGAYDLNLSGGTPNSRIEILLLDEVIYKGKVKNIDDYYPKFPWNVSLHGGATQDLDSVYNQSFYGEVDLGYRFSPFLSAELIGGYYAFDPDHNVGGAALLLRGHLSNDRSRGWEVALAAGGGFYFPKGEANTLGYTLRASIGKNIGSHGHLAVEGGYTELLDTNFRFIQLGLGWKYRF